MLKNSFYRGFFALGALACSSAPQSTRTPQGQQPAQGAVSSQDQHKTCLAIVDGTTTNAYPATFLLLALDASSQVKETCTGTFVGDNVLITAAHCIPAGGPTSLVALSNSGSVVKGQANLKTLPHGLRVFLDPALKMTADGPDISSVPMSKDLAVVLFPAGTATAITPVARSSAPAGTPVTLVGYGANDTLQVNGDNSPTVAKKFGPNTVAPVDKDYPWDGLYQVRAWGHPGEAAQHGVTTVSAAPGDSGGPLLRGNTLIGTVKYGYTTADVPDLVAKIGTDTIGFWVDITNPTARGIFAQAEAAGAHITYEAVVPAGSAAQPVGSIPTASSTAAGSPSTGNGTVALPVPAPCS